MLCSCGEVGVHVVARRQTADGRVVLVWSDGAVTGWAGMHLVQGPGRAPHTKRVRREAAALLVDEVALYDWCELAGLVRGAQVAARALLSGRQDRADCLKVLRYEANRGLEGSC